MEKEIYLKPIGYENWFTETNVSCDTDVMLNTFMPDEKMTEHIMDLTDCLKTFFVTVRDFVKNNDFIYARENHYLVKPIITQLMLLKNSIYDHIDGILNNLTEYIEANSSEDYFNKLAKKGILTNEEVEIISDLINLSFQNVAESVIYRNARIVVDYADDSPDIYFSIKDNKHINMDETPLLVLGAPYEIEPGLINLKYWAVTELFRVNKVTEICAKITTESPEIKKSILSTSFDAKELISAFEYLSR